MEGVPLLSGPSRGRSVCKAYVITLACENVVFRQPFLQTANNSEESDVLTVQARALMVALALPKAARALHVRSRKLE